jgi:tetratricopeptide (TPR) repeat protein
MDLGRRRKIVVLITGIAVGATFLILVLARVMNGPGATTLPEVPGSSGKLGFGSAASMPSKENVSGKLKDEIDHLRALVAKDPKNTRAAFQVAQLLQDSHDSQAASVYYALGLKSAPKDNAARIDYSLCLYQLGKKTEAREQCRIVLRSDPANAPALFNLGAIFANEGGVDSARAYWSKLISRHPNDALAAKAQEHITQLTGS